MNNILYLLLSCRQRGSLGKKKEYRQGSREGQNWKFSVKEVKLGVKFESSKLHFRLILHWVLYYDKQIFNM